MLKHGEADLPLDELPLLGHLGVRAPELDGVVVELGLGQALRRRERVPDESNSDTEPRGDPYLYFPCSTIFGIPLPKQEMQTRATRY